MTMKGQEDSIPLTENDQMASWKKTIENMTELLKILSDKDNWDLGARDETRYLHEKKQHFNFQQLYLLLSLACAAQPTTGEVFWQAWLQRQSGDTTRSGATLVQVWKIQQKFRRDKLIYSFCSSGLREMHGM